MTMNRREFACLAAASTLMSAPKTQDYFVYVGGYTGPKNQGIQVWRFDSSTGKISEGGLAAETQNPSFLAIHPNGKYLFAANEIKDGTVSAFSRDAHTGKLTFLNSASAKGGGPCYVSLDPTGKYVFVANYGGGSIAAMPIGADGRLSEASSFIQHTGSSVNQKRQREPHAHCIKPSKDGRFVLAADLGTDELKVYKFRNGALTPNNPASLKLKPGAGPRHFAFHPQRDIVYIINELDSTITPARWDPKKGAMTALDSVSTLPAGGSFPDNSTAEIVAHPNGRVLYGSNRGHNSIAVFDILTKGGVVLRTNVPTKGEIPRNFALDPTGNYLFTANQRTNNIVIFRVDKNGDLAPTDTVIETVSPVCVRFAPAG